MKDWEMIYTSSSLPTATMVTSLLIENEVPAKLLNKKDTSYVFLGAAEVYIPANFFNIAKEILKSIELDILDV